MDTNRDYEWRLGEGVVRAVCALGHAETWTDDGGVDHGPCDATYKGQPCGEPRKIVAVGPFVYEPAKPDATVDAELSKTVDAVKVAALEAEIEAEEAAKVALRTVQIEANRRDAIAVAEPIEEVP